jgi:hypothetical protein
MIFGTMVSPAQENRFFFSSPSPVTGCKNRLQKNLLFPPFVEFQDSLPHSICRFMGFPVFVHAFSLMEQARLLVFLCPDNVFSFIDAEANPAVQAF